VNERVRKGTERLVPADEPSPGGKAFVALVDATALQRFAALGEHEEVTRYVENTVVTPLVTGAFPPVAAFVEVHLAVDGALEPELEDLVGDDGAVYRVSEYVKK
jgi:hypothetical protein